MLTQEFFSRKPDVSVPAQRVTFGTSGHRGSALNATFNEDHIVALTQAICRYRASQSIDGPLYMGRDTHALSEPAFYVALEVLAANGVHTMIDANGGYTPTPVISHAILCYNKGRSSGLADGIVITPSHNPPEDGGFKYNPPNGGPAATSVTAWIERFANAILDAGLEPRSSDIAGPPPFYLSAPRADPSQSQLPFHFWRHVGWFHLYSS